MKQNLIIGLIAAAALVLGLVLAVTISPPGADGPRYLQEYPQPRQLPDFELFDQHGEVVDKARLQGHWTLAFVGYTFCPDICPTTLAELKRIYPQLLAIESQHPVQVWFISVDPQRDTQPRLLEYTNFFNPDFIGSSGDHTQLFPLVRAMGMMYSMDGDTSQPNYEVSHSASVVLVNPEGLVIGRFKAQHAPGGLAISDTEQILADMPVLMSAQ